MKKQVNFMAFYIHFPCPFPIICHRLKVWVLPLLFRLISGVNLRKEGFFAVFKDFRIFKKEKRILKPQISKIEASKQKFGAIFRKFSKNFRFFSKISADFKFLTDFL